MGEVAMVVIDEGLEAKTCKGEEHGPKEEEEEEEESGGELCSTTLDGSVDRHGNPCLKMETGGWGVGSLILVNQGLTNLAFFGVGVNLVEFVTRILRQDNAEAANTVSQWTGTSYIFSIVGALISDSYWGRYKTCLVFQCIFIIGLILLSLSSYLFLLRPCVPGDGAPNCAPPTTAETAVFYLAIYQIALGMGAYQPAVTTFGADQFDAEDPREAHSKVAFFSYVYVAMNIGTLASNTGLVYAEDKGEWVLGFWVSSGAALLALVMFVAGVPWYRHFRPDGNPVSRIAQVVVATVRKWRAGSEQARRGENLYGLVDGTIDQSSCQQENTHGGGGGTKYKTRPRTSGFKFLDRAAVITPKDTAAMERSTANDDAEPPKPNPWRLCSITQVEEVKCVLRLLPIWLCTIIYSVDYTQMASVFIEQGAAMNTSIAGSRFHIPPASMSIFEILSVAGSVFLYRTYLMTLCCKLGIGGGEGLTQLQKMGVGLLIAALGMVAAGVVEFLRLKHAVPGATAFDGQLQQPSSSLSILWQVPSYVLVGASEVFMYVGQLEFFNDQAPDGLKSFGSALYVASMAMGSYISSLFITIVVKITGGGDGGKGGWISDNLNEGRMDMFFFLLAVVSVVDLVVFVACARWYQRIFPVGKIEVHHNASSSESSC